IYNRCQGFYNNGIGTCSGLHMNNPAIKHCATIQLASKTQRKTITPTGLKNDSVYTSSSDLILFDSIRFNRNIRALASNMYEKKRVSEGLFLPYTRTGCT
ncbi:hypothetical protein K0M31_016912, partial [Melipona bicolor]